MPSQDPAPWSQARATFHTHTHPSARTWFDTILDSPLDTSHSLLFTAHNIVLSQLNKTSLRKYYKPYNPAWNESEIASITYQSAGGTTHVERDLSGLSVEVASHKVSGTISKQRNRCLVVLKKHPALLPESGRDWTRTAKVEAAILPALETFFEEKFQRACGDRVDGYVAGLYSLRGKDRPRVEGRGKVKATVKAKSTRTSSRKKAAEKRKTKTTRDAVAKKPTQRTEIDDSEARVALLEGELSTELDRLMELKTVELERLKVLKKELGKGKVS